MLITLAPLATRQPVTVPSTNTNPGGLLAQPITTLVSFGAKHPKQPKVRNGDGKLSLSDLPREDDWYKTKHSELYTALQRVTGKIDTLINTVVRNSENLETLHDTLYGKALNEAKTRLKQQIKQDERSLESLTRYQEKLQAYLANVQANTTK
jgi:hypothetical protein